MTYFDKLLDNAFRYSLYEDCSTNHTGYSGLIKNEKDFSTITLAVPGLSKDDIELEVKDEGVLCLKFLKQTDFFRQKSRTWTLSDEIDIDNVAAECKDGMLTVMLPKVKKQPVTRKISVS